MAGIVEVERAIARISNARTALDLKKAVSVDRNVEGVPGLREVSLGKGLGETRRVHAVAGRHRYRAAVESGELRVGKLEAGRIDVGNVVADRVDVGLRAIYSRQFG